MFLLCNELSNLLAEPTLFGSGPGCGLKVLNRNASYVVAAGAAGQSDADNLGERVSGIGWFGHTEFSTNHIVKH